MSRTAGFILKNPNAFKDMAKDIKHWIAGSAAKTVNETAYAARENIKAAIEQQFNLRNAFTLRQVQYTRANYKGVEDLSDIFSTVGITKKADYMERQDSGGEHRANGAALNIATDAARGGSFKDAVRRKYHMSNIDEHKIKGPYKNAGGTPKSRAVARAFVAAKEKKLVHYGSGNIFAIDNFEKTGNKVSFDKNMIYERTHKSTYTPANIFFMPAVEAAMVDIQERFNINMDKSF